MTSQNAVAPVLTGTSGSVNRYLPKTKSRLLLLRQRSGAMEMEDGTSTAARTGSGRRSSFGGLTRSGSAATMRAVLLARNAFLRKAGREVEEKSPTKSEMVEAAKKLNFLPLKGPRSPRSAHNLLRRMDSVANRIDRNRARRNSFQDEMAEKLLEEEAVEAQMEEQTKGIMEVIHRMLQRIQSMKENPSLYASSVNDYKPAPLPLANVKLPEKFEKVATRCAATVHEMWMKARLEEGWTYGQETDHTTKRHMWLVPFDKLPGTMQQSNISATTDTIKVLLSLGYRFQEEAPENAVLVEDAVVPESLNDAVEILAYHSHERWSISKMQQGFVYGVKDGTKKTHPGLVPYYVLSESEQQQDRQQAINDIKSVIGSGYRLVQTKVASELKNAAADISRAATEFKEVFKGKTETEALKVLKSVYLDERVDVVDNEWSDKGSQSSRPSCISRTFHYIFKKTPNPTTANLNVEEDSEDQSNWFTIAPGSVFTFWWNLLLMLLVLYTVAFTPYILAGFGPGPTPPKFDLFVETVFLVDLALNFITGIVDPLTDEVIMNHYQIQRNYIRGYFFIDLLSSIPVEIITSSLSSNSKSSNSFDSLKTIRMFKLARILKLLNLKVMDDLEEIIGTGVFRLGQYLSIFIIIAHLETCTLWGLVSTDGDPSAMMNLCDYKDDPGTTDWGCYNDCFYAVILVIVGNRMEYWQEMEYTTRLFVTLITVIGMLLFSSILGGVTTTLNSLNTMATAKERQINVIRDYMKHQKVPGRLQKSIVDFVDHLWRLGKMSQVEETVLHRLPDVLQLQLRMSLKQHVVDMIPMFQKLQPLSVLALINRFQSKEAVLGQIVVHQREVADRVYFLVSGRVAVCRSVTAKPRARRQVWFHRVFCSKYVGDFAGRAVIFCAGQVHQELAKAVTFCDMQVLLYEDLADLLQTNDEIAEVCYEELERYNLKTGSRRLSAIAPLVQMGAREKGSRRTSRGSSRQTGGPDKKVLRKKLQDRMDKIAIAAQTLDPTLDRSRLTDSWAGEPISPRLEGSDRDRGRVYATNNSHRISNPMRISNPRPQDMPGNSPVEGNSSLAHRTSNRQQQDVRGPQRNSQRTHQTDAADAEHGNTSCWNQVTQAVVSEGSAYAAPTVANTALSALAESRNNASDLQVITSTEQLEEVVAS